MTTTVQSTVSHRLFRINALSGGDKISVVSVDGHNPNRPTVPLDLDRAEFLAAVATELDVMVIPRTDLPPIAESVGDDEKPLYAVDDSHVYYAGFDHRSEALRRLAIAEYLAAHPPIDQAQVDALTDLLMGVEATTEDGLAANVARRLLATGRVTITDPA